VQKELELQRLKSQTTSLKALLGEIGFLEARFNSELKKSLKGVQENLIANKKQEKKLMIIINQLSKGETNTIAATLDKNVIQQTLKQEKLDSFFTQNELIILNIAEEPFLPVKPDKLLNLAIALIIGIFLGMFFILLARWLKSRIHSEQDIKKHLDLPVLGVIPKGR